jgi:hypothetical protein
MTGLVENDIPKPPKGLPDYAQPTSITEDMAMVGSALYWAIYHAPASLLSQAPDHVVRAYARAQQVFGPPGKPPLALVTTRQLLEEIKDRGELETLYVQGAEMAIGAANLLENLPASMLAYPREVDG